VLNRELPGRYPFPESFSLERDFLEKMAGQIKIGGFIQDRYFIDIGIPEDYAAPGANWHGCAFLIRLDLAASTAC